jgi:pimeloyl-ACP methyl ester carboxylesterase
LLKNLKRTKEGNFRWLLNIKTIRNELPAILDGLDIENPENRGIDSFPVLFIKGEKSDYIQKKDRQSILDIFPHAVIKEIEGAGHWVHAEKRMEFLDVVKSFLTSP